MATKAKYHLRASWAEFEPYVGDQDELGLAQIRNERISLKSVNEWKEEGEDVGMFERATEFLWHLPPKPRPDEIDTRLREDVLTFIHDHVVFEDDGLCHLCADYAISTWLFDEFPHIPRLIIYGPTNSGKSRLLGVMRALSYHGYASIIPSGPALYRIIEIYHPTVIVDEFQDLFGEKKTIIEEIFKGGWEKGQSVPRCNDQGGLDFFNVFSPMIIGVKSKLPAEDLQNRSFAINMMQKPVGATVKRTIDLDWARELTGRLLSLKLRASSGIINVPRAIAEAYRIAEQPYIDGGEEVVLDDRTVHNAAFILTPGVLFGNWEGTLRVVVSAKRETDMSLSGTMEARIFYALQVVIKENKISGGLEKAVARTSTLAIADQLNLDLKGDGNAGHSNISTRRVTEILRALGFPAHRGAGNRSYLNWEAFQKAYERNLAKYGKRLEEDLSDYDQ